MPVDFQIRPIGRPQISEDSSLGYRKISRRYTVEGPKVSKLGMEASPKLFRPVGEADEEFTDYFLVAQQIEPTSTVDKAHLTRTFVQFRNSWFGESVSENRETKRLSRRYMVLKQEKSKLPAAASGLGYDDSVWSKHPASSEYSPTGDPTEPWDMLPTLITNSEPSDIQDSVLVSSQKHPFGYAIGHLSRVINEVKSDPSVPTSWSSWVRGSAQVDTSNPGFDVWNVSWVAPSKSYWAAGASAGSTPPLIVDFDEDGLRVAPLLNDGTSSVVSNFTCFFVGESVPTPLLPNAGTTPYVTVDVHMVRKNGGGANIKQTFKNAVFKMAANTNHILRFQGIDVAKKENLGYGNGTLVFNFDAGPKDLTETIYTGSGNSQEIKTGWSATLPRYQATEIINAGGHISWTHVFIPTDGVGGNLVKTVVTPVHSHRGKHIWRINFTYA